jgi:hypothetical protein
MALKLSFSLNGRQKEGADMKKQCRRHLRLRLQVHASVLYCQKPGLIFLVLIILVIALVASLVARLVSFIVFVFIEVPLPEVVPFMRLVILAFAQPLLVPLVFRIILVLTLVIHCRRRHSAYRASNDTRTHRYRQNPDIWLEIHSHKNSSLCLLC